MRLRSLCRQNRIGPRGLEVVRRGAGLCRSRPSTAQDPSEMQVREAVVGGWESTQSEDPAHAVFTTRRWGLVVST